jgi:hypothetical protein
MFLTAGSGRIPCLEDPDDFFSLEVRWTSELPPLAHDMAPAGYLAENHVWLDPQWLRAQGGSFGPEWEASFDAMVDFARSKGWTDPDGFLRAHIVPTPG